MGADFKVLIIVLYIICFPFLSQGQRMKVLADRAFDQMQYATADELYSTYFEKFNDTSSLIKQAYCHIYQGHYQQAISLFDRTRKWVYKDVKWCTDYARSLQYFGQSDSSIAVANRCVNAFGYTDKLGLIISTQSNADQSHTDSSSKLTELHLEGHESTACPVSYKNQIIFTAPGSPQNKKDPWTGLPFSQLYIGDVTTGKSKPIDIEMANDYHVGSAALYDDKLMYFTSNSIKPSKYHEHNLHIAMAGKTSDGKWVHNGIFQYSSPEYSTAYPCFSANDSIMIFCADKPGGKGGFDLYMCIWDLGRWAVPKHLSNISSSGQDVFPWIEGNHTLYFASDGLPGNGGLDIYKISLQDIAEGIPKPLDKPINSYADDFALSIKEGVFYLTSNRSGQDKIYFINNSNQEH